MNIVRRIFMHFCSILLQGWKGKVKSIFVVLSLLLLIFVLTGTVEALQTALIRASDGVVYQIQFRNLDPNNNYDEGDFIDDFSVYNETGEVKLCPDRDNSVTWELYTAARVLAKTKRQTPVYSKSDLIAALKQSAENLGYNILTDVAVGTLVDTIAKSTGLQELSVGSLLPAVASATVKAVSIITSFANVEFKLRKVYLAFSLADRYANTAIHLQNLANQHAPKLWDAINAGEIFEVTGQSITIKSESVEFSEDIGLLDPLQLRLIAEVYQSYAERAVEEGTVLSKDPEASDVLLDFLGISSIIEFIPTTVDAYFTSKDLERLDKNISTRINNTINRNILQIYDDAESDLKWHGFCSPGIVSSLWYDLSSKLNEGESGTYTLVLKSPPDSTATIAITSTNPDITLSPASLTFTTDNWYIPQTVRISAAQDNDTEDESASLTYTATGYGPSDTGVSIYKESYSIRIIDRTENQSPEPLGVIDPIELTLPDGRTKTANVAQYFSSSNSLNYEVNVNPSGIATASVSGSRVTITPVSVGVTTVVVTARDTVTGLTAIQRISVSVIQTSAVIVLPPANTDPPSTRPDYIVEPISVNKKTLAPGEFFTLSATVHNQGSGPPTSNATLNYYRSTDDHISSSDKWVSNDSVSKKEIIKKSTSPKSITLKAPTEPGVYYYGACVSGEDNESNIDNNCSEAVKITVHAATTPKITGSPDLVVELTAYHKGGNITTISPGNYRIDPNDYFRLRATVTNQGDEDAEQRTTVRYYLSKDATISPEDDKKINVGIDDIKKLKASSSDDHTIKGQNINGERLTQPGDYYYYASVDSVEGEGNTKNNYSNVIKVSVRGPDLVIDSVFVDYYSRRHTTVRPNGIFSLHATIKNQGTDKASDTTLRYYVSSDDTFSADDDTEIDTDWIHKLDPNETEDVQSNSTSVNYVSGVFYCFVCIDSLEDEISTDNNCYGPIQIRVRNVAPVAKGTIDAQTLNAGTAVSINVSDYFVDENNDTLTYSANSSDDNIATASESDAQVIITPKRAGTANITVTASDGEFTATQTISVTVVEPNRAPVAIGTIASRTLTAGDAAIQIDVSANFQDADGDNLKYSANSDNNNVVTVSATGSQITITPVRTGSATITVTANDGTLTATQTISILVVAANRAPTTIGTISDRTLTVGDAAEQVDVSSNFQDPDNDSLTYTADSDNTNVATASESGSQITITPVGTGTATITVTASDGTLTATQTISVTVTAAPVANRAPVTVGAISDRTLTVGDAAIQIDVSNTFNDPDNDTLTYNANSDNTNVATASESGSQITITPVGVGTATITVTASDGTLTATQTFIVSVTAASEASEADWMPDANLRTRVRVALGLPESEALTQEAMTRLTNLTSLIGNSLEISNLVGLEHATQLQTLILQYHQIKDVTPLQNLTNLTYLSLIGNQISDVAPLENLTSLTTLYLGGNPITNLAPLRRLKAQNLLLRIDIEIDPLTTNSAPVAVGTISARTLTVDGSSAVLNVSSNFSDADDDTLTYTVSSSATNVVTVSVLGTQVTITPVDAGSATITVTASDGTLTATQTISVTVTSAPAANRAPVTVGAISVRTLTVGDSADQIDVSSNFSDPDDDDLTYTATSSAISVATVSVSGSQVTITPVTAGNATITVTASDGTLSATQSIAVTVNASVPEETWMPDAILRATVRSHLRLQAGDVLTQQKMTELGGLHSTGLQIRDLTGLEYATNVTSLSLDSNQISDLSSLQNLTELTYISLFSNPISDITPLQNLTKLTWLTFGTHNVPIPIGNITALSNLTELTNLTLRKCQISDITPLQNLSKLTSLNISGNTISDISPLQYLTELASMDIYNNSISDITPLQNLTKLTYLWISQNQISDITPLQNLTKLTSLRINNNRISNITPLQNLTELRSFDAPGNSISDLTPLQNLTNLRGYNSAAIKLVILRPYKT